MFIMCRIATTEFKRIQIQSAAKQWSNLSTIYSTNLMLCNVHTILEYFQLKFTLIFGLFKFVSMLRGILKKDDLP